MAIAVDGSSPAGASQTNGATATVTTASFTPAAGAVMLACWQGNTTASAPGAAPTIADTLTLAWTSVGWRNEGDAGGREGQAAMWWALSTNTSMTVTVTTGTASGDRQARLKVVVLTGVDTANPVASSNEGSDTGGGLDNLTYTSTVTDSMGFASVSDWDTASSTFTAGGGTTIVDSAQVASVINCATLRQTTPTSSGSSISLALTSPTSTTWNYVWAEMRPGAAATGSLIVPRREPMGALLQL